MFHVQILHTIWNLRSLQAFLKPCKSDHSRIGDRRVGRMSKKSPQIDSFNVSTGGGTRKQARLHIFQVICSFITVFVQIRQDVSLPRPTSPDALGLTDLFNVDPDA